MAKILILCPNFPPQNDGIAGHTQKLCFVLSSLGHEVGVLTKGKGIEDSRTTWGILTKCGPNWSSRELFHLCKSKAPDFLLVPYTPLLWGDRGGLGLGPILLLALMRLFGHSKILVFFHEVHVPWGLNPKYWPQSLIHRAKAWLIGSLAHSIMGSCWHILLQLKALGHKQGHLAPVGSNIPVAPQSSAQREKIRAHWGLVAGQKAIGIFGGTHVSRNTSAVLQAIAQSSSLAPRPKIIFLGTSIDEIKTLISDDSLKALMPRLICTGKLPENELSHGLGALDVMASYFVDGVSARRGSVFAGLEHGIPVVSTWTEYSDSFMANCPGLSLSSIQLEEFTAKLFEALHLERDLNRPSPWKDLEMQAFKKALL